MNGVIIINKAKGCTSFDIVAEMRKLLNIKKIGHAGTLDPMATGVLPILIGSATKIQDLMQNKSKEYLAKFKLGIETDTEDITGKILKQLSVNFTYEQIEKAIAKFQGNIEQIPPMYSSVKKNGIRLYSLARCGIEIERKKRIISIYKIKLLEYDRDKSEATILVDCSKGTYIRTLCADIGKSLGCGAAMTQLCRTKSGIFTLGDSITLDKARELSQADKLKENILPIDSVLKDYDKITITKAQSTRFKNGGSLFLDRTAAFRAQNEKIFRVYSDNEVFLGLASVNRGKNELKIYKLLN